MKILKSLRSAFSMPKVTSVVTAVALVLAISVGPHMVDAASITSAKATFGRLKIGVNSESGTIQFATPTGIQTGGADTITFTFSGEFVLASEAAANFDIELGDSATCSSATYTDEVVALTASATDWGVDVTGNVITLSPETDQTLTAGFCMRLVWGTAATTGGTGAASTIVNATAADDDDTIVIAGDFGDSGTITVDMIDDDQVTVSATVNQTLSFDLDTAEDFTNAEDAAPYSVALGTLSTGSVSVSNTSSVKMIVAEGATNASGGMNVTVANANGTDGLKSTSTPADKITSGTATMAAGTTNYGLCVATSGLTGFTRATGYVSDTCALSSSTNGVRALSATPTDILTSAAPVGTGHAEIVVNAAIDGTVPAHTDYADTLTFVATATF
jgi:hypothetical protein